MKIILEHEQKEKDKEVTLSFKRRTDGSISCHAESGGIHEQTLLSLGEKGLRLFRSINPKLGFPLDSDGRLKILDEHD